MRFPLFLHAALVDRQVHRSEQLARRTAGPDPRGAGRPLADGWSRFEVGPDLGDLEWAAVVVPAPCGDIVVMAEGTRVTVHVPNGAVLVRDGHAVPGPSTVEWRVQAAAGVGEAALGSAAAGA